MTDYIIKQEPEDFIVNEVSNIELDNHGDYAYFFLKKKGRNTVEVTENIANFLKIMGRHVGFAGAKDRNAETTQLISIKDPSKSIKDNRFDNFDMDGVTLEYFGRGKKPLSLGDLEGNEFIITLKECTKEPQKISHIINYFDDQRFSTSNAEVGKSILKKDFKKAVELIRNYKMSEWLQENPTDLVTAIKKIPMKIRLMYLHAYQSYLWNTTVSRYLDSLGETTKKIKYSLGELIVSETDELNVPLIGFDIEDCNEKIDSIISDIMKEEKIGSRDFIIRSMPELSAEGGTRTITSEVKNLKIEKIDDKTYKICFTLPKGCYATMAVKQMFC